MEMICNNILEAIGNTLLFVLTILWSLTVQMY